MFPYIVISLGAVSLFLFLVKRDRKSSISAIALKALTSVLFVVCGILSLVENINTTQNIQSILPLGLLVLGLVFGLLGDVFLDFKIYFKTLNMRFLCLDHDYDILMITGMASFAIGHIFYIIGILLLHPTLWKYVFVAIAAGIAFICLVMVFSVKVMKMDFRKFLVPSVIYGALLGSFAIFTIIVLIKDYTTGNLLLMIGSILFLVSDLVLCMTYFSKASDYERKGALNPESRLFIVVNHVTYYFAQFLIAIAIMLL